MVVFNCTKFQFWHICLVMKMASSVRARGREKEAGTIIEEETAGTVPVSLQRWNHHLQSDWASCSLERKCEWPCILKRHRICYGSSCSEYLKVGVYAPADAEVTVLLQLDMPFGLRRRENSAEILIHVGIDAFQWMVTVLKRVAQGDKVKAGSWRHLILLKLQQLVLMIQQWSSSQTQLTNNW